MGLDPYKNGGITKTEDITIGDFSGFSASYVYADQDVRRIVCVVNEEDQCAFVIVLGRMQNADDVLYAIKIKKSGSNSSKTDSANGTSLTDVESDSDFDVTLSDFSETYALSSDGNSLYYFITNNSSYDAELGTSTIRVVGSDGKDYYLQNSFPGSTITSLRVVAPGEKTVAFFDISDVPAPIQGVADYDLEVSEPEEGVHGISNVDIQNSSGNGNITVALTNNTDNTLSGGIMVLLFDDDGNVVERLSATLSGKKAFELTGNETAHLEFPVTADGVKTYRCYLMGEMRDS